MARDSERKWGPSRRHEITYSRTYVMYLVPLAVLFSLFLVLSVGRTIYGLMERNGETILEGLVGSLGSVPLVALSWWNALRALRDRKIQRHQLR